MNSKELLAIVEKFKDKKILVIGDVMLDHYISGSVERICPEAPVPVLNKKEEFSRLGGAANVALNIATLGGKCFLIGTIGKDKFGEEIVRLCKENKIEFFPEYLKPTTVKTRIVSGNYQLLRIDSEDKSNIMLNEKKIEELAKNSDLIVISDYAKGTISKRIFELVKSKKVIVGPKPKNKDFYKGALLITLNKSEAKEMSLENNIDKAGEKLRNELSSNVVITKSEEGMSIYSDKKIDIPTFAKEVYDVSGAGDVVLATLSLGISTGANLEDCAIIANYAAGIAVGKRHVSIVYGEELKKEIGECHDK